MQDNVRKCVAMKPATSRSTIRHDKTRHNKETPLGPLCVGYVDIVLDVYCIQRYLVVAPPTTILLIESLIRNPRSFSAIIYRIGQGRRIAIICQSPEVIEAVKSSRRRCYS